MDASLSSEYFALRPDLRAAIEKAKGETETIRSLLEREDSIKTELEDVGRQICQRVAASKRLKPRQGQTLVDALDAQTPGWQGSLKYPKELVPEFPLITWCEAVSNLIVILEFHDQPKLAASLRSVLMDLAQYYARASWGWMTVRTGRDPNPTLSDSEKVEWRAELRKMKFVQRQTEWKCLRYVSEFLAQLILPQPRETGGGATESACPRVELDVPLTADGQAIVFYLLGKHPTIATTYDIEADTLITRKTAGRLVNDLIGKGLLHRPSGKRSGVGLTHSGLALARRLRGAQVTP